MLFPDPDGPAKTRGRGREGDGGLGLSDSVGGLLDDISVKVCVCRDMGESWQYVIWAWEVRGVVSCISDHAFISHDHHAYANTYSSQVFAI